MRGKSRSEVPFGPRRSTYYGPRGLCSIDVCLVVGGKSRDTLELLNQLMMSAKKPQDISEPTIHDTSKHLDFLAMMTMTSPMTLLTGQRLPEAYDMTYYSKEELERSQSSSASEKGQNPGIEGRNGEVNIKVKIMSKSSQSQAIRPFDTSKGQVCALVPGQAIDCGIGPAGNPWENPEEITYPSAKDVLRWNKTSEWLENWERQHPTANLFQFQPGYKLLGDLLRIMPEYKVDPYTLWEPLVDHISDFPGKPRVLLDEEVWFEIMEFIIGKELFLVLLVILPLVYGGIHLATWNFHFASKTEHLLWKIACIDIMGTIPAGALYYLGVSLFTLLGSKGDIDNENRISGVFQCWAFFLPLSTAYALARLYIVVESFISLRHVPIGSYAAVPWVQDIPHV